jgi:ribose transport system permease protein
VRKAETRTPRRFAHLFGFDRIGAVYIWLLAIVVFTVWAPATFPTLITLKQILNTSAITGIAALAVLIPLAAGVFDLSFAYVMSLSGVVTAFFVARTDIGLIPGIAIALAVALGIGLVNGFVVVVMKINSFIGTMATGLLVQSLITMFTNDTAINDVKLSEGFSAIGQTNIFGITLPVLYMLIIAFAVWYLFEHTAVGRRLYATGYNPDAARLASVNVNRLRFGSLIVSAFLSGIAGIVLASTISTGSPTAGTPYLLGAFAAAFLGATQLKRGRMNAWGTLIAVLLLGTGTTGLSLAGAPQWAGNMFTGIVLIGALAVTSLQRRDVRKGKVATK